MFHHVQNLNRLFERSVWKLLIIVNTLTKSLTLSATKQLSDWIDQWHHVVSS